MKTTKYKLSDMAKDLKVTNNDLIECLGKLGGEPKKTQSVLTPEEISYVLEYYTQNNQVDSFDAFYANNVKPVKEEKKADKKPVKAEKKEKKVEKKPEPKPAPKAEAKPEPKPEPKAEPRVEKKPEVKVETKQPAPEQKKKQPAPQKPAKKKEHGVRQQLGGFSDKKEASGGYTISEDNDSFGTQRTIDTRGSYIELDKYNEKYDNLANSKQNKSKDNFTKKQKLTQKSQQRKKQQFSHKKETESEKLRRLELERARKQQLKVMIPDEIVVSELASRLKVTATEVIKKLMGLGVMASINEVVDFDTAALVAEELGAKVEKEVVVTIEDQIIEEEVEDDENAVTRPPVVCVMGHVDHGKTSILDAIRNTEVTSTEAGGITQAIGAYQVDVDGQKITFLDTPGHAAFTAMRARGAMATDIAVLVVAADDGIMPQTVEAINHAKAAGVEIIVAINKMDKEGANPDKVMQQLTEHELVPEEWGGDVICVPVSAKTKMGIDKLLETILLVSEMAELKANPDRQAKGVVIEAKLDKGRGPIATLLVQNGTLNAGDIVVAGTAVGKIRAMSDYHGKPIETAGPSVPVEIMGLDSAPMSGDEFNAVSDEKLARALVEQRKAKAKEEEFKLFQKVTLDTLFDTISEGEMKELNIIVKADVQGSVEAVKQSLLKIENDEVNVKIVHGAVGAVSESDVMLAEASKAIIVAFNTGVDQIAADNAKRDGVEIKQYDIIYDAIEDIERAMRGMRAPKYRDVDTGEVEVREVYKISSAGTIAGSLVTSGTIKRDGKVRVIRNGKQIADVKLANLKRFKDEVKEVSSGYECGISLDGWDDIQSGDILQAYIVEEYRD